MADRAISALPTATTLTASDLFVLSQGNQAKNTTWSVIIGYLTTALDGHGGIQSIVKTGASGLVDTYTVTLADETTYSFTVTNGKAVASITQYWAVSASNSVAPSTWYDTLQTMTAVNRYLWSKVKYTFNDASTLETTASVIGVYGDTGDAWYVHIKYASQEPTADADMGDVPDKWIGIYSGTSSTAPTSYTSYDWFQYKGDKGDTGDAAEILSQSVTYMEASSGTVIPSGSWTETIPPVTQGNFLWTRTILSFNDGSTVTSYSVARFGVDGTGSVASVNNVSPDGNGNVALAAANIPMSDNQSVQKHVADLGSEKADRVIISGVEESSTAANSYSVGQYLILSGVLYRVTAAITAGDTITDSGSGANIAAATVGGELTGLRNTLTQLVIKAKPKTVAAAGTSGNLDVTCAGLTSDYEVVNVELDDGNGNLYAINNPPADISIDTGTDKYILNAGASVSGFRITITFALPQTIET